MTDERSREEPTNTDERSREEPTNTDERSREEPTDTDERSREEPTNTDERSREEPTDTDEAEYRELVDWLTAKVAGYLKVTPELIGGDTPLADYGIDSAASLALCADLECEKGYAAETTIVWDYATIEAIAAHLVAERAAS